MIRTKIKVLGALALGMSAISAVAQPSNQFFLKSLPQAYYLNPGQLPEGSGHMGFLGWGYQYAEATSSGFQLSDMMVASDTLSLNGITNSESLVENNYLGLAFRKDLFNFGWKWKEKNYWSLYSSLRMMVDFNYSSDFINFFLQGNGTPDFLSKGSIDWTGTRYSVNVFSEVGIGYGRQVNDQLTIGGKLKYLAGIANFNGSLDGITVTTAPDLTSLMISSSMSVQSASPLAEDANGDLGANGSTTNGHGMGLDIGGSYKINDQITAYLSAVDLGFISWGTGKTLSSDGASFTFTGFSYSDFTDTTSTGEDDVFTELADSVQNTLKLDSTSGSYTSYLPARFFVGGTYQFHPNLSADLLYSGRYVNGQLLNSATVGLGIKGSKWYEGKLTYTIAHNTYANVGFASVLNLGALQLYFVTDNILGLFQMDYSKHLSGAAGINLTFGRKKYFEALEAQKSAPDMPATSDSTSTDAADKAAEEAKEAKEDAEKAEEKAEEAKDDAKDAADEAKDDAKDAADDANKEAKEAKEEAEEAKEDAEKAIEKAEEKAEKRIEKAEEKADDAEAKMKQMEADKAAEEAAAAEKAAVEAASAPAPVDSVAAPVMTAPLDSTSAPVAPAAPASTSDSTKAELTTPSMDDLQKTLEEIKGEEVE